jgi:hypothetical protein
MVPLRDYGIVEALHGPEHGCVWSMNSSAGASRGRRSRTPFRGARRDLSSANSLHDLIFGDGKRERLLYTQTAVLVQRSIAEKVSLR